MHPYFNDHSTNTHKPKKEKDRRKKALARLRQQQKEEQKQKPQQNQRQNKTSHLSSAMTEPTRTEPGISERRGIRWIPGIMSEPTSTLVLTSSLRKFVDVRIFCKPGEPLPTAVGHLNLLDWAIAGESSSVIIDKPTLPHHPSNPPFPKDGAPLASHSTFNHWLDSRTDHPDPDEGDMYPQSNGTVLELGIMHNPAANATQPYEEIWADFSASAVDGTRWSIVIDLEDVEHRAKGRIVRVGEHCQGVIKVGEQVTVERWKFEECKEQGKSDWKRLARLGDLFLPCSLAFRAEMIKEGNTVTYGDYKWTITEVYSW